MSATKVLWVSAVLFSTLQCSYTIDHMKTRSKTLERLLSACTDANISWAASDPSMPTRKHHIPTAQVLHLSVSMRYLQSPNLGLEALSLCETIKNNIRFED